jgi:Flp pilus assembly protein TadG
MRRRMRPDFFRSHDGSATVEFVVIFMAFIAIVWFVMEVTLYLFFMASLEKAAQAGVRAAVVSPPIAGGVPSEIAKKNGDEYIYGYKCSHVSSPCEAFAPVTCNVSTCQAAPFARIVAHMRGFNGRIQPENVTVTYSDAGIGFAGGPLAPMVTVTVSNVPFQTGILALLLQDPDTLEAVATLPARSTSMTGEDLAS